MFRRVFSSLVVMVGLIGCDQVQDGVDAKAPATPRPAVAQNNAPPADASPVVPAQSVEKAIPTASEKPTADRDQGKSSAPSFELTGKGDQASQKFSLQAGLSLWQVEHDGRHNFQVSLLNQEGREVSMPLNEIGTWKGTLLVGIAKPGEYLLNVRADGKWAITIREPRPESGASKPFAKQGKGSDLAGFVTLPDGLNVFRANYTGEGIFRVKLVDRNGKLVEHIFAQLGPYEGSKAISLGKEGLYAIGVYASGPWSLKIE